MEKMNFKIRVVRSLIIITNLSVFSLYTALKLFAVAMATQKNFALSKEKIQTKFLQSQLKNALLTFCTLLFLMTIVSGCKNFLDTELQGVYSNTSFYQTKEHAVFAINATYEITAFKNINNNLWVFGDVASDDARKGGNPGDQADIGFIDEFIINPDNGFIETIWKHYYEGIVRANKVIYYVPGIEMDDDLKQRIIGEAKFLRAYFYFHLVNIFGEVPLKIQPAFSASDLHVPVSSVADIYLQIEQDLTEASQVLPVSYSGSETGRATKGAALGLLAKSLLFQQKWQAGLEAITSLEQSGYSLMPLHRNNFELLYENNAESVFEIQHLTDQVPFLGSNLNQWFSPQVENGYFFNAPTQNFVDEFEVAPGGIVDPRLDYTVGRENQKWLNGEDFDPAWSPTGYLQKKHIQPLSEIGTGTKGDGDLNYTFMRYAEVLLLKAEALNELGRGAEALIPLNEIRKRARESYLYDENLPGFGAIPAGLLPDVSSANQTTLRAAIQHERRVELGFEFHRFYDLMRYGAAIAEAALSDTNFNYATHRYFPIPQSEIDTNNSISN